MDQKIPKLTNENKALILKLHNDGMIVPLIRQQLPHVSQAAIRAYLQKQGYQPHKAPSRKKSRPRICVVCGNKFEDQNKGARQSKCCSPKCVGDYIAQQKVKYNLKDIQAVIDLKSKGVPIAIIEQKTGVNRNKIKEITKENELFLTPQARQENAYHHKTIKNPNAMEHMRQHLTPDVVTRRIDSITNRYLDNYDGQRFADNANQQWATRRSNPFEYLKQLESSDKQSETKLGMSLDEFEAKLLQIKSDVENNLGTVCTLAGNYGLHYVTACRAFNKRGWDSLLNQATSQAELDIFQYVKSLLDPSIEVISGDRSAIAPLELDIYVPSLKFGIEYNGLYWHSSASDAFKRGAHKRKKEACESKGVDLLAIFEDEWANPMKRELLKAMIRYRLKKFNGVKIRASKLNIKHLTQNKQFEDFFEANHIDGHSMASFAKALVDNEDKIIACMSYRVNHNGEAEIARFATDYNYYVHGGANRLFQSMIKSIRRDIVSYSNNRLSSGNIYKQLGFSEIDRDNSSPSYWYTDLSTRVWRFRCKRNNDPEILAEYPTEEIQAANGVFSRKIFGDTRPLFRIEDYGHRKWIYKIK